MKCFIVLNRWTLIWLVFTPTRTKLFKKLLGNYSKTISVHLKAAVIGVSGVVVQKRFLYFQCVPYLISMGTDSEAVIRIKADQQLQEIEKKYPGFIHVSTISLVVLH